MSTETTNRRKPPIRCTPCRLSLNGERFRVYEDGSVGPTLTRNEAEAMGMQTIGEVLKWEREQPRHEPHSEVARRVRQEASRLRRNRNARERNQAMRDLGMKKTPYGWE